MTSASPVFPFESEQRATVLRGLRARGLQQNEQVEVSVNELSSNTGVGAPLCEPLGRRIRWRKWLN